MRGIRRILDVKKFKQIREQSNAKAILEIGEGIASLTECVRSHVCLQRAQAQCRE